MMNLLLRYRIPILLLLIGATALIGVNIRQLRREAGISALLPKDNPDYIYWKEAEEIFGSSEQVVVGVTTQDTIYTKENIRLIHELTQFFEGIEDIDAEDIASLTAVDDMEGTEDELLIEPLIDTDDLTALDTAALQAVRERVRSNPLFHGKLVSLDERSTVVIAPTFNDVSINEHRVRPIKTKTIAKVAELQERYPDVEIYVSGMPMVTASISEYMQRDIRQLFPVAILVVLLMLFFLMRSVYGMLLPVLVTIFSVVWTFGLKGWLNSPLTIVETVIPVMLIAIGCADGVHIMSEFLEFVKKGFRPREALIETMHLLTLPVILTSVTTGMGFASLITSPGVSIKNMGIFLAFGVMVAMVFSLLFIPAVASWYRPKRQKKSEKDLTDLGKPERAPDSISRFEKVMKQIGTFVLQHKVAVFLIAMGFLGISILGVVQVNVEADELKYFKSKDPIRVASEHIQQQLGGVTSLDIVIEGTEMDAMKDPKLLQAIEGLQRYCESHDLISYTLALPDYVKRINYVLHGNDPEYERLPNEIETVQFQEYELIDGKETLVTKTENIQGFDQVAQFLLLYEMGGGDALENFVDDEYSQTRVIARLQDNSTQQLEQVLGQIQPYIQEHFGEFDVTVKYTNHYVRKVMSELIIRSQIYSIVTVFLAIFMLMAVQFRSLVVGMITSIPVFIAVLFNFAVMWTLGITLNVGTSIVASVGMGVGIDYAIHYFSRFRILLSQKDSYDTALLHTIVETSRSILSNAAAVALGFLVLIFSKYNAVLSVGWITALSMVTTALSSLVVLPAMLAIFKPKVAVVKRRAITTEKAVLEY